MKNKINNSHLIDSFLNKAKQCFERNQLDEALSHCMKIIEIDPNHSNTYNNIGIIFHKKNDFEKAIINYEKAIEYNPNHKEALNNLGTVLKDNGQIDAAIEYFKIAIEIEEDFLDSLNNLATCFYLKNQNFDAIEVCLKILRFDEDNVKSLLTLSRIIKGLRFNKHLPEIEQSIYKIIEKKISTPREMGPVSINMLLLNPVLSNLLENYEKDSSLDIDNEIKKINKIPLLKKLISEIQIVDIKIERFLGYLRKRILLNYKKINRKSDLENILSSLSFYYVINEYISPISEIEKNVIQLIDETISKNLNDINSFGLEVLILSCYKRLNEYSWSKSLLNFKYSKILKVHLQDYFEENEIKKQIPRLDEIEDEVSKKIRKQYESYPYPRWNTVVDSGNEITLESFLNRLNIKIKDESISKLSDFKILIAGCGTGQTSVINAKRFSNSDILAIDLSLSSLSYASRKVKEFGIKNINFMQADILDLKKLNKKFHFIECTGVLHHMKDPIRGLQILNQHLEHGGFIKIGLYSKYGRKELNQFKTNLKVDLDIDDPQKLISFREKIIENYEKHLPQMFLSIDFFSLSGFKDYLLNVHENQYCIEEIISILKNISLEFCGFEFPNSNQIIRQIKKEIPDFDERNLADWNDFELKNPSFFSKMYQFWCQKV